MRFIPPTLFFAMILWFIFLADSGQAGWLRDIARQLPYGDKFGHFILFGLLTLLLNIALRFSHWRVGFINIQKGSVYVLVFALVEELSQYYFPSRTVDIDDVIADLIGVGVFTIISVMIEKFLKWFQNTKQPSVNTGSESEK